MRDEWISARDAVAIVSDVTAISRVHDTISSRAHAGLIASRARRFVRAARVEDECDLPAEFWSPECFGLFVQNWSTGDLHSSLNGDDCRAYGVEFRRRDIEAMLSRRTPQPFRKMPAGNFASAERCVEELKVMLGCSSEEAASLILRGCRASVIQARCAHLSWRVTHRYGQEEYTRTNEAVPDWFWEHCIDHPEHAILNWHSGRFAGRGIVDGDEYKAVISGVEFEVAAIVDIEGVELRRKVHQEPTGQTAAVAAAETAMVGRRPSERWRPWIAELVAHIHEHGIPEGIGSQGQEELISAVADALASRGEEGLGRSTVQPVVQAVLDRLRDAEKG
jgi:hypothetical protein